MKRSNGIGPLERIFLDDAVLQTHRIRQVI